MEATALVDVLRASPFTAGLGGSERRRLASFARQVVAAPDDVRNFPLGRLDLQVVRDVEDVRDERPFDRGRLEPQVEVAERYRVGAGYRRPRENAKTAKAAKPHGRQW